MTLMYPYSRYKTNSIMYKKEGINLKTVYTIEYIDTKKEWEILCANKHPAPWELFKKKVYEDLQDAINQFIVMYSSDSIYEVKLWESIELNNEVIQERCIDGIDNFKYIVNNETKRQLNLINDKQDTLKYYEKQSETLRAFLKKYHAEETYKKFEDEQNNNIA